MVASSLGDYSHLHDTAKFQANTLIGNWLEQRELQRSALKQLLSKKTTGTLRLDAYHQRMATALQEVDLIKASDDPYVHFGDVVQLVHLETGSVLACDVSEKDTRPGEEACAATAAPEVRSPCARNAVVLLKYTPPKHNPLEPDYPDNVLRYGQKVRLAAHPYAHGEELTSTAGRRPLCLFSKPVSMTHFAKYCRNQLVGFTYRDTFDTVWEVVTPNPAERALSQGVEVLAGAPVLLMHCATKKPLLVEDQKYPNEFGVELELSVRVCGSQGLKLAMEHTSRGILKGALPKGENSGAFWSFMSGTRVAQLPAPQPDSSADVLVSSLAQELLSKQGSIAQLERKLILWENNKFELPADELLLIIRQVGSTMPESDVRAMAQHFAVAQKRGVIDGNALLSSLRRAA